MRGPRQSAEQEQPARVLLVSAVEQTCAAIEHALDEGLGPHVCSRVARVDELAQLSGETWDVVLSEHRPGCVSARDVLRWLQDEGRVWPVIAVTESMDGVDLAELMRAGARDVVSIADLTRLAPAIERELRDAADRLEHRRVDEAYQTLVENSLQGLLILQDGTVLFANASAASRAGLSPDELRGMTLDELVLLVHRDDVLQLVEGLRALERDVATMSGEIRLHLMDGSTGWFQVLASRIELGGRTAVQAALVDVTAAKRMQQVLHRGKQAWERTFDAVSELILILDRHGVVERLNRSVSSRLGVEPRDLVGLRCAEVIGSRASAALDAAVSTGEMRQIEMHSCRLGGVFQFSATPRVLHDGRVDGSIIVGRDVTVQREAEEVLRRQLSIDQAEQIFGTFRHEIGNALNTLKTTVGVLRRNLERFDQRKREEYFDRCFEAFRIAEQLLHTMRSYQTLDHLWLEELDLEALLRECSDLLFERPRAADIACSVRLSGEPVVVKADPDALVRVLLNVVGNSVAACATVEEPRIDVAVQRVGEHAVVTVTDNGEGMPPENLARAFSPFFTTRADGTGMGLAIVQKLMIRMNGLARIRSEGGAGVSVELRLPSTTASAPP